MLTFEWPWLFILLPLPILYRMLRSRAEATTPALKVPVYSALSKNVSVQKAGGFWHWFVLALLAVTWIGLLAAAARPTWVGDPIAIPSTGRDLLMAVDISGSMQETDMQIGGNTIDRLSAVKQVVGQFVERRQGDRMGLILFGTRPYLQTPLTFDRKTLNVLLNEAQIGFAGDRTAIGDAIGLAVKRLQPRPKNHRVLILLTDGANSAGRVKPLEAADIAAREGIVIHTIGIGAEVKLERTFFGTRRINPSSDLDETTLLAIAEKTGGQYFRARNPAELETVYSRLDELEPVEQEAETLRPSKALFYWPLGLALICSFIMASLINRGDNR